MEMYPANECRLRLALSIHIDGTVLRRMPAYDDTDDGFTGIVAGKEYLSDFS